MSLQLSTKGRYGVRAAARMAFHYKEGPVSIHALAADEQIPRRYLEQIMNRLRKKGIVRSKRGRLGGYFLSRPPGHITLAEIIEDLEGTLSVVQCLNESKNGSCPQKASCTSRRFWVRLNQTILDYLNSITLQDFVDGKTEGLPGG